MEPSNKVHDTFRRKTVGRDVTAPFNSKPMDDDFYVDRSRLGTHDEWNPDAKNEWGGKGKIEQVPNDIRLNAISGMGELRKKSSYVSPGQETPGTGAGPCCVPELYPPNATNPMYRKRKE